MVRPAADGGPYQEYVLTEKGAAVSPSRGSKTMGRSFFFLPTSHVLRRQEIRLSSAPAELRSSDGRVLAEDTVVRQMPNLVPESLNAETWLKALWWTTSGPDEGAGGSCSWR